MFDPDAVLTTEQLVAVLEAARWAATWGHRQPVRFVVGFRGDDTFAEIADLLKRGNSYAQAAGALILVCADEGEDERTALYAAVDAGAAIAQLTIEAVSRGLIAHPMAGFDADGAREVFGIPAGVRPIAVVAVGSLGDYDAAPPDSIARDALGGGNALPLSAHLRRQFGEPAPRSASCASPPAPSECDCRHRRDRRAVSLAEAISSDCELLNSSRASTGLHSSDGLLKTVLDSTSATSDHDRDADGDPPPPIKSHRTNSNERPTLNVQATSRARPRNRNIGY